MKKNKNKQKQKTNKQNKNNKTKQNKNKTKTKTKKGREEMRLIFMYKTLAPSGLKQDFVVCKPRTRAIFACASFKPFLNLQRIFRIRKQRCFQFSILMNASLPKRLFFIKLYSVERCCFSMCSFQLTLDF